MLAASDFEGEWQIERRIEDRRLGQEGRFDGAARLLRDDGGLRYREEGLLRLGGGPTMAAHRDYLWLWRDGRVEMRFSDGRPFHSFRPEGRAPGTDHPCGRDRYRVTYDFVRWPFWQAEWVVTGPAKAYRMVTAYRRG